MGLVNSRCDVPSGITQNMGLSINVEDAIPLAMELKDHKLDSDFNENS
jgi:hypothetical protein